MPRCSGPASTVPSPLIVDMVRQPRMDEDAIEPARDLALQAPDAPEDDPAARAGIAVRFSGHFPAPFNRSTLGKKEGFAAIMRRI